MRIAKRNLFSGMLGWLVGAPALAAIEVQSPLVDQFRGPDAQPVFELREYRDGNWRVKLAVYASGRFEGDIEHTGILINRIPSYGLSVAVEWMDQHDPSWRKT